MPLVKQCEPPSVRELVLVVVVVGYDNLGRYFCQQKGRHARLHGTTDLKPSIDGRIRIQ